MKNISIYIETLCRNTISRTAILCLIAGIILVVLGKPFLSVSFFTFFGYLFYQTNFGMNSYVSCHRYLNHLVAYQNDIEPSPTPCAQAGYKVAMKKFRKNYPVEYDIMRKKQVDVWASIFIIIPLKDP